MSHLNVKWIKKANNIHSDHKVSADRRPGFLFSSIYFLVSFLLPNSSLCQQRVINWPCWWTLFNIHAVHNLCVLSVFPTTIFGFGFWSRGSADTRPASVLLRMFPDQLRLSSTAGVLFVWWNTVETHEQGNKIVPVRSWCTHCIISTQECFLFPVNAHNSELNKMH